MKPDTLYTKFGKLVRGHRNRLGLTQDQLGGRVGLSRTSITNIEQGRQKVLLHQVFLLARSLEISPEVLLPNLQFAGPTPHLEQKLKDLRGPEKDWARRIVVSGSKEGGTPNADSKD